MLVGLLLPYFSGGQNFNGVAWLLAYLGNSLRIYPFPQYTFLNNDLAQDTMWQLVFTSSCKHDQWKFHRPSSYYLYCLYERACNITHRVSLIFFVSYFLMIKWIYFQWILRIPWCHLSRLHAIYLILTSVTQLSQGLLDFCIDRSQPSLIVFSFESHPIPEGILYVAMWY